MKCSSVWNLGQKRSHFFEPAVHWHQESKQPFERLRDWPQNVTNLLIKNSAKNLYVCLKDILV